MTVDGAQGPVLAKGPEAPSLWARYRFYTAGKVPKGHESWVWQRLPERARWLGILLLINAGWLVVTLVAVAAATRDLDVPDLVWYCAALSFVLAPWTVASCRTKVARALASPPADEVLKDIGEPVPPRL
jgi:hypothetical protein